MDSLSSGVCRRRRACSKKKSQVRPRQPTMTEVPAQPLNFLQKGGLRLRDTLAARIGGVPADFGSPQAISVRCWSMRFFFWGGSFRHHFVARLYVLNQRHASCNLRCRLFPTYSCASRAKPHLLRLT